MSNSIEVTETPDLAELEIDQIRKLTNAISDDRSRYLAQRIVDVLEDRTKTSVTDPLTGLWNRRRLEEYLKRFAERYPKSWLAILAFDIDDFKRVNDEHGHPGGDKVLVAVAKKLSDNFRPDDLVCRFGGDEFIVVVTGAVSKEFHGNAGESRDDFEKMVSMLAQRAREAVEKGTDVTVSVGFDINKAEYFAVLEPLKITYAADVALYDAKSLGKNHVVMSVVSRS